MVKAMIKYANNYKESNLSVIPVKADKSPNLKSWIQYQAELPSNELITKWFNNGATGIGIIAGKVSGNLEVIDFDNHNNDIKEIFNKWKELLQNTMPGLFDKLVIETTINGGYHIYYRCNKIGKSTKIARRHLSTDKVDTFIETRGEGGYVVAAPSLGYEVIQGKLEDIQLITEEERECILAVAYSFNEVDYSQEVINTISNSDGKRPGDEYNTSDDFKNLLQQHGWKITRRERNKEIWTRPKKKYGLSATWNYIPGKFYVFSTNAYPFEDQRTYTPFSIYTLLNYGDLSTSSFKAASKQLISEGYGKQKRNENKEPFKRMIKNNNYKQEAKDITADRDDNLNKDNSNNSNKFDIPDNCIFFYEYLDNKGQYKLGISKSKLINYFEYYGFRKYWVSDKATIFIRIIDNIVSEQTIEAMFDFLKSDILSYELRVTDNCDKFQLWECILHNQQKISNQAYLATIDAIDGEFLNDTQTECFVPFINGVAKVEKGVDFPKIVKYEDIDKYIWKNTIIQRKFKTMKEAEDTSNSMFGRFLEKVCSPVNKEYPDDRSRRIVDEARLLALMSSIGYLIHTYKDPTVTKAIIYCEEQIAEYDDANGRTGKGLTFNAISKVRKHHLFNGKQVNFNERFMFQSVSQDTQVLVFDDVRKRFDFEALFSILTEGICIEPKGKTPFIIPFERSPKVLITTNSVISNDSGSHKARKFEIEFSDYYSVDYTPFDDLGGYLFEKGWSKESEEWDLFYNLMLMCVKVFLERGLMEYNTVNLEERKLLAEMPEDFIDFATEEIGKLKDGEIIYRSQLYDDFTNAYPIYGNKGKLEKTPTKITQWFNKVLKYNKVKTKFVDKRLEKRRLKGWQIAA